MGRTSILQATAVKQNGVVTATFIGGRCVPVMSGTINLT
jgi:trans-2,3-dihydro-3-hydroxyanthranilate isomerase